MGGGGNQSIDGSKRKILTCRLGYNAMRGAAHGNPLHRGEEATPTVDPSVSAIEEGGTSVSAMMRNLLPLADSSLVLPSEGVYVGDGVPPVPQMLAELIRRGGYVEMGELLSEFWSALNEEPRKEAKGRQTEKVTDIFMWLQCFASYVAVRVTMTPRLAPELLAY